MEEDVKNGIFDKAAIRSMLHLLSVCLVINARESVLILSLAQSNEREKEGLEAKMTQIKDELERKQTQLAALVSSLHTLTD